MQNQKSSDLKSSLRITRIMLILGKLNFIYAKVNEWTFVVGIGEQLLLLQVQE